jgi:hypothetical protein
MDLADRSLRGGAKFDAKADNSATIFIIRNTNSDADSD